MAEHVDIKAIPLQLYNTESRTKEVLKPIYDHQVRMYTCGPTVYHYAHIGNFRTYVFEDLLRRTIKFFGMNIIQVMNLTDVDDKTRVIPRPKNKPQLLSGWLAGRTFP